MKASKDRLKVLLKTLNMVNKALPFFKVLRKPIQMSYVFHNLKIRGDIAIIRSTQSRTLQIAHYIVNLITLMAGEMIRISLFKKKFFERRKRALQSNDMMLRPRQSLNEALE